MKREKKPCQKVNTFLTKTFDMVSSEEWAHVVTWTQNGTAFQIQDVTEFTNVVLPKFFKHKNFASFVRQLNMYGFHKIRDSGETHIFSHPCFVRNQKAKLRDIQRKSVEVQPLLDSNCVQNQDILCEALRDLRKSQKKLKDELDQLKHQNQEVINMNQSLLQEIYYSRDRELKLEQTFSMFFPQMGNDPYHMQAYMNGVPQNSEPNGRPSLDTQNSSA